MKKNHTLSPKIRVMLLVGVVLSCMSGCRGRRVVTELSYPNDSIYSATHVMRIYSADPRRALQVIDSIEMLGQEPDFLCDYLRATVYSRSPLQQYDSAIAICNTLLKHDSLTATDEASLARRQNALSLLCSSYRMQRDYEMWLVRNMELADICRQEGEEVEALRTDAETGFILAEIGRREEGLALLDKTIEALEGQGSVNRLDASIIAIKRKINVLQEFGQPEQIIPLAHRIRAKVAHFRQHTAEYADDSYRLPASMGRYESYCDFTESQIVGFLANAFAVMHEEDSCRYWLAQYEKTPYSRSDGGRRLIVPTWLSVGRYANVLAVCEKEERRMGADTVNDNYADVLRFRASVAEGREQLQEACGYWRRYALLRNVLNDNLQTSTAHTYAARFHLQEQQRVLEQQNSKLHMAIVVIVAVVLLSLLLIAFAIRQVQQRREMDNKNRILAQQISELVKLKTSQPQVAAQATEPAAEHATEPAAEQPEQPQEEKTFTKTSVAELKLMTEAELFQFICHDIRDNRLYTDLSCDRQKLAERYGLSFAQIGAAFSRGSDYDSVADFIRECRLDYACRLLTDTNMLVTEVARSAGFSRTTTFNHDFKTCYGLTPSEYRKQKALLAE